MKKAYQCLMAAVMIMCGTGGAWAQYDAISCSKRPFNARLVQMDQLNGSTVLYFEYFNDGKRYVNVYEDIAIRDSAGNVYPLLNSYNMPLSDEDHSRQLLLTPEQQHRFALEFEQVPTGRPFSVIESEGNSRAMNFYDVRVDTTWTAPVIDYDNWIKGYPVKEAGSYVEDGEVIQYIAYKGVMVTAHMQVTKEYGKYYTIDVDVQNYGDKDILFDPARITATSFIPKKKKVVDMNVLSAEDYDKRVRREQNWTRAFVIVADVALTAAVAAAESSADKKHRHDRPAPPPRHHGWRPAHHSHHPYYPTDHYRSRYQSHNTGGLATSATALVATAATAAMFDKQNTKREQLEASYVKANTIKQGGEYLGYFHIKHETTDNLVVNIPLMGEVFDFRFQWQDKK